MSASSHELTLAEAVPLAHALVARAASDCDVRVLFIKGPVAAEQGLRPVRPSVDVDVLVDPRRRGLLAGVLDELGWVDENPYLSPTVLPQHSLTHRHDAWPCELDLHDRFPGFFADPQAVFEALWERRTTARVAAQELAVPDRTAHALILALHSLRDPHAEGRRVDQRDLEQRLVPELSAQDLEDLAGLAHRLGAADTAAPFLRAVGAPPIGLGSTSAADLAAWRLRTDPADTTAVSWVAELRRLPWRARPRYLWYAAWLTDEELLLADPRLAPDRRSLRAARLRRLRRGLSAVPRAVRSVRQLEVPAAPGPTDVVIATLLRPTGETGVQTHMQALVSHLRAQGRTVTIVSPFAARSLLLRPAFAMRLPLRRLHRPWGVRWYRSGHAHYLRAALGRQLLAGVGEGVVYAQCPVSAQVALDVRRDQPVVMVAHFNVSQADEWAERGEIERGGREFRAIRAFEDRVLPRLDGIVHVSSWSRAELESRTAGLDEVPAVTVPNFVEIAGPLPAGRVATHDLISVGSLEPRKNQGYLVEVVAAARRRGRRVTLSLVGDGGSRAEWERRAAELGVSDQVRFLGFRPDPRSLMADHRLYVHAATVENLPLALLEAMAEGLPVLAVAVGGIPSMVREGHEGAFWQLDDPDAAADILLELLEDVDRLQTLGRGARRRVETEYAADVVVPRLEAFLDGVRLRP